MSDLTFKISLEDQLIVSKGESMVTVDQATGVAVVWEKRATLQASALSGDLLSAATATATTGAVDAASLASLVAGLVQSKGSPEGITGLLSALPVIGPMIVPGLKVVGINLGDVGGVLQQGLGFITDLIGSGVASADEEADLKSLMDQIEAELAKTKA